MLFYVNLTVGTDPEDLNLETFERWQNPLDTADVGGVPRERDCGQSACRKMQSSFVDSLGHMVPDLSRIKRFSVPGALRIGAGFALGLYANPGLAIRSDRGDILAVLRH